MVIEFLISDFGKYLSAYVFPFQFLKNSCIYFRIFASIVSPNKQKIGEQV